jgi:poly(hydroxyalkanoate) depolymerase family esterase
MAPPTGLDFYDAELRAHHEQLHAAYGIGPGDEVVDIGRAACGGRSWRDQTTQADADSSKSTTAAPERPAPGRQPLARQFFIRWSPRLVQGRERTLTTPRRSKLRPTGHEVDTIGREDEGRVRMEPRAACRVRVGSWFARWGRPACVAATVALLLLAAPGFATATAERAAPGKTTRGTVISNGDEYRYRYYTPKSYSPAHAAPLVVVVHGCQTTAKQEQAITRYDRLAERKGFVVLYPDVDAAGRTQPGPLRDCWKFLDPNSWKRGSGDSAAIADMTRAIMAKRSIARGRVYLAGISAGGLMASVEAAAYPDIYAAVAVMSSSAYSDWTCFTSGGGIPVNTSAQLAFDEMGRRARVVPTFVLGGDSDLAFPWSCTAKALEQGLRTANLVADGSQQGPISLEPATIRRGQEPGGHAYTVRIYHDPSGCRVGESWRIHGMGHFWSGGTTDPAYAGYTDVKGPSAAKATWAFFQRYRKSDTGLPCAEAPPRGPLGGSARQVPGGATLRIHLGNRRAPR